MAGPQGFYYNDAGQQINNLALSVQARARGKTPDDPDWPKMAIRDRILKTLQGPLRPGRQEAADRVITGTGDIEDPGAIRDFAVACLRREQDQDLRAFQVVFDEYFLESSLYDTGPVENTVAALRAAGHTYDEEGALWLRTTDFGDDKDRVMRKREEAIPTSCRMSPTTQQVGARL